MNKFVAGLLVSYICLAAAAPSAMGTAYTWNQAAGGPWFFGSDWLPNTGPPTTGDTATFALGGAYNVSMSTTGDKADSVTVTGSVAHPTLQSVSTIMPGVLTVTTGVATFNVLNFGDVTIGSSTRPVNVTVGFNLGVDNGDVTIAAGST